jgi:hypothetical protein
LDWEEIDFKPGSDSGGRNYGWPIREGRHDFNVPAGFDESALTDPVIEYVHVPGRNSVTGGFVYRGPGPARLNGVYLYGDFSSGQIWGLKRDGADWQVQELARTPYFISTFGEDDAGRLFLADYVSGNIYSIEDNGLVATPTFTPPGGTSATDLIKLATISSNAVIRYTTDGRDPTEVDPGINSGETITVVEGMTLKARAFRADLTPSEIAIATYTLQAARPVFTPVQGPVINGTLISIRSDTPGATVRYTLDGSDPGPSSTLYAASIAFDPGTTLKARAFRMGFADSEIAIFSNSPFPIQQVFLSAFGDFVFNWASAVGRSYQVQVSDDAATWRDSGSLLSGTGGLLSVTNRAFYPKPQRRYFRIKVP